MPRGKVMVIDGPDPDDITSVMADIRMLITGENNLCEPTKDFLFRTYEKLRKDAP